MEGTLIPPVTQGLSSPDRNGGSGGQLITSIPSSQLFSPAVLSPLRAYQLFCVPGYCVSLPHITTRASDHSGDLIPTDLFEPEVFLWLHIPGMKAGLTLSTA